MASIKGSHSISLKSLGQKDKFSTLTLLRKYSPARLKSRLHAKNKRNKDKRSSRETSKKHTHKRWGGKKRGRWNWFVEHGASSPSWKWNNNSISINDPIKTSKQLHANIYRSSSLSSLPHSQTTTIHNLKTRRKYCENVREFPPVIKSW